MAVSQITTIIVFGMFSAAWNPSLYILDETRQDQEDVYALLDNTLRQLCNAHDEARQKELYTLLGDLSRRIRLDALAEPRQEEVEALLEDAIKKLTEASIRARDKAELEEVYALIEEAGRKILEASIRTWLRAGPHSFKEINNADELIEGVPSAWPQDWFPVKTLFNGESRNVCALPLETFVCVKYGGSLAPEDALSSMLHLVCRDFAVAYDIHPIRWTEALQDVTKMSVETDAVDAPSRGIKEYGKQLAKQTELSMRRTAALLATSDPDYKNATLVELCLWATCTAALHANGGMWSSVREIQSGEVTMLVEYDGKDLLESKSVHYSLFVDGYLYYKIAVSRRTATKTRPLSEGWRDRLATVHRSVLTCGLRLLEKKESR